MESQTTELQQPDKHEDINRQPTAGEMQLANTRLNFQPSAICGCVGVSKRFSIRTIGKKQIGNFALSGKFVALKFALSGK